MLRTLVRVAIVAAIAFAVVSVLPLRVARADGPAQKPKATRESVLALRNKLAKARDDMRAMARTPAPQGLTTDQRKVYETEMTNVLALADGTDAVVKKLDNQIDQIKADLDSLSEMGEMESLRLQMAMDRLSKMMSTLSNLLKKISDTASQITQNLK